jgi:nucleotide-binding universal stress UspA family protein
MFERILVPLDGSSTAENVLPYVSEIASRFGSQVVLARVCEPATTIKTRSYLSDATEKMKKQLEDWQARDETEVHSELRVGNPALQILNLASEIDCNLTVIASRGATAGGEAPWPLGNIAGKVVRASPVPVLLVKKPVGDEALKTKKLIKKILLPLDGSELGEAALPLAGTLARILQAEIILFQVIEPLNYALSEYNAGGNPSWLAEYEKAMESTDVDYLNGIKEIMQTKVPDITIATATGSAADEIIDFAEANSIDLIAMATHGRSGISKWVFGSVTDKVLHAGDKPVLVVRSKEKSQI